MGATLRMVNSCEINAGEITRVKPPNALIPRFQELEYIRAYLLSKMGWSFLNCLPKILISGGPSVQQQESGI